MAPSPAHYGCRIIEHPSAHLYLDLLRNCLTRTIFDTYPHPVLAVPAEHQDWLDWIGAKVVQAAPYDPEARRVGLDWPVDAETMVGQLRLENLEHCVTDVLRNNVPGDLIETGVWRGGASILMRGVLKAYGDDSRRVWVADSFEGLPRSNRPPEEWEPADDLWTYPNLAVSMEQVQANFARYGLLDDQVCFLPGWFQDTLAKAPIRQLAVARLDGDLYESTMCALEALYPKLSPGGYLIVDDYSIKQCVQAVSDYRSRHDIDDPIIEIDWTGVYWQKSSR